MAITNNLKISRTGVYLVSLLLLTIVIVPLAAAVLTLSADKAEYNPGDTLVVSGTATPDSAVAIQVFNPAGGRVAFGQASTDSEGAFSTSVLVWPPTATVMQPLGTYRISASDAGNGDTIEITVTFAEAVEEEPVVEEEDEVSTTTITITVTRTTTTVSTTTETSTTTNIVTTTSRITRTTTETSTTTNTLTTTTTLPRVTTTTTAVTTTTATSSVTNTVTADAVTQTSTVTHEVTETEEVGSSGTVTYVAIAVAVIAIIGAAVLTMKQRGML
ncbi:MAG: hypothetical protein QF381_00020 [Nitrososphaerales archaeon]|jgi:hypothetical protein|nr:hypothetical protein [Nitrososphaerales archaeon]|tara:strand:- start:1392 stop:2210 length:819 start_codon:yes stop_codon:yes gene_type:complete